MKSCLSYDSDKQGYFLTLCLFDDLSIQILKGHFRADYVGLDSQCFRARVILLFSWIWFLSTALASSCLPDASVPQPAFISGGLWLGHVYRKTEHPAVTTNYRRYFMCYGDRPTVGPRINHDSFSFKKIYPNSIIKRNLLRFALW